MIEINCTAYYVFVIVKSMQANINLFKRHNPCFANIKLLQKEIRTFIYAELKYYANLMLLIMVGE